MELITLDKLTDEHMNTLSKLFMEDEIIIVGILYIVLSDKTCNILKMSRKEQNHICWFNLLTNKIYGKIYDNIKTATSDFLNLDNNSFIEDLQIYKFDSSNEFISWLSRFVLWK